MYNLSGNSFFLTASAPGRCAVQTYYLVVFLLSMVFSGIYVLLWQKNFDVHISLVFFLVPVANLAFLLQASAETTEAALTATRFSYIGGCFLQLLILYAVFGLCRIRLPKAVRFGFMLFTSVIFLFSQTIGHGPLFYTSAEMQTVDGRFTLVKEYGPVHTVFYIMVITYYAISIAAIVYTFIRKNQVSRKILLLLFLPDNICILFFFLGRAVFPGIELTPAGYLFAQLCYLFIAYRMSLYNVARTAAESVVQTGENCYISFDPRLNYIGSNDTARSVLPELNNLTVDLGLHRSKAMDALIRPWLEDFRRDPENGESNRHIFKKDDRYWNFTVRVLRTRGTLKGYEVVGEDNTADYTRITSLTDFNNELNRLVDEKTAHIVAMHDNLIMSMATMVESRDNSTGGHIRRTSEGVRILLETAQETGVLSLEKDFVRNLIKAAPMHDLGKIAVPDQILRKPGRFEPEEFEIMKTHAAEGGRIVHEILKGTDDDDFHRLAENVANYHHERWDGSGYPQKLKGEEIPLEARIMAVADVYDALVSKRVYKEKMSFEKADAIIREGMGSQFDPALEPVYLAARPRLEAYYASLE